MKKIDLGQLVTVFANLGVLVGIAFLAYELRQNTVATQLAATNAFENSFSQHELFIADNAEFADILHRADMGESLAELEQFRLTVFFRSAMRAWQAQQFQYLNNALDEDIWAGQIQSLKQTIRSSPATREFWEQNQATFTPEFNEMMQDIFEEVPP
jgi:hypothetical protein